MTHQESGCQRLLSKRAAPKPLDLSRALGPVVSCQADHAEEYQRIQARYRQDGQHYSPHELAARLSLHYGMRLVLLAHSDGRMQQSKQ